MISPFLGSKTASPLMRPSGWDRRKSGTTGRFGTLTMEAETLAPLGLRLNGRLFSSSAGCQLRVRIDPLVMSKASINVRQMFSINVTLLCLHCIRCLSSESRPRTPPWRTVGIHVFLDGGPVDSQLPLDRPQRHPLAPGFLNRLPSLLLQDGWFARERQLRASRWQSHKPVKPN